MIVNARHSCGTEVPIPCVDEFDAYCNPAYCPTCYVKFFPRPPGGGDLSAAEIERRFAKKTRFKAALEAISRKLMGEKK